MTSRSSILIAAVASVVVTLAMAPAAVAQQGRGGTPSVTGTIAIENARIVTAPGRVIERGTVVMRDGIIESVGASASVPFDARRIAGDSLVVYAGFIDGLSHAAIPRPPERSNEERVERPGAPPPDRAGIQPQRSAASMLTAGDESIGQLRSVGFAAAHVVPHGLSLPGQGAIVLLGGETASDMVLERDVTLFAQFQSARGVYPATDMATLAAMRQMYREAERRHAVAARYAENPDGLPRPPQDEVHSAFFPVIANEKPVVFHTDGTASALQVRRALELQRSLGFRMVLAGVGQGFEVVDALREAGHPVLLTLGFPEEPADAAARTTAPEDTARAMTPEPPSTHFVSDHRTLTYADLASETDNLRARQARQRERYYATAADLDRAGIAFGFSTMGVKASEVRPNLRRMIEHGLTEDAALAALTTNPARILGIANRLGTVERGKIANLVVTDGPLFHEGTQIRYVIVDGRLHEVPSSTERNGDSSTDDADPVGTWTHRVEAAGIVSDGQIVIERDGTNLRGHATIDALPGRHTLQSVSVDGDVLSFAIATTDFGIVSGRVTIRGDAMTGTLQIPAMGPASITATRTSSPRS